MLCIECNSEIKGYGKKFCSRSCSVTYNNKLISKRTGKKPINKVCIRCDTPLLNKNQHKYCSKECQMLIQRDGYIESWKTGSVNGMKGKYGISNHIRKYIFEKYGNMCSSCGWSIVNIHTGNIPLQIDHIDGNHKNNDESNLRLLCPNCHSLTPTYGGANRGYGRGKTN